MSLRLPLVALAALLAAAPATAQATRTDYATGLSGPGGLAVLGDGRVLVPEFTEGRVSVLAADGTRTDYATDLEEPYALAVLGDGRVLVAEYDRVSVLAADGKRTDYATGLELPRDLAVLGDGRVLVAEPNRDRVSVLDADSTRTNYATGLRLPEGLAVLGDGRVLVTDYFNDRVSVLDADGKRTDYATDLRGPHGLAVLGDGRVLVAERNDGRVSVLDDDGTRSDYATGLSDPTDLAVLGDGRVLVVESDRGRVSVLSPPSPVSALTEGTPGDAAGPTLVRNRRYPMAGTDNEIVFQSDGNLAVYDAGGAFVWGLHEVAPGRWSQAASVVYDAAANRAVVRDAAGALIWEGAPGGGPQADPAVTPVPAGSTALVRDERYPMAGTDNEIVFQSDGNLVVYTPDGGDGIGGFVWGLNEVAGRWSEAASVVYDEGTNRAVVYDAAGGEIWRGAPGGGRD